MATMSSLTALETTNAEIKCLLLHQLFEQLTAMHVSRRFENAVNTSTPGIDLLADLVLQFNVPV